MNRRKFLLSTGVTAAGVFIGCDIKAGNSLHKDHLIGLQLYSVRDEVKDGLDQLLGRVAAAGYGSVEMYGFNITDNFFKHAPGEVAAMLKAHKLISPSGHYQLDLFDKDGQQVVDAALALGHRYVVIPWFPPEQRDSLDDYKVIAEKINKAARLCKDNKLRMAYHNHDFEFTRYDGGVSGYDILLKECDKDLVDFELDLYWVKFANENALDIFKKNPGRIKMWHVKDMDKNDPKKQTAVGSGIIDFKSIFAEAELSGMEYFYVEQENLPVPGDDTIKKSSEYVRKNLLPLLK